MVAWIAQTAKMPTLMKKISAATCRMVLSMGLLPCVTLGCYLQLGALGFPFQLAAEVVFG
jgi:hypothetical protein